MDDSVKCVTCPNCLGIIWVQEVNCAIFRHGIMKENGQQIDPHASEELCAFLRDRNLIFGCGKPLRVLVQTENNQTVLTAETCDYI